MTPTDDQGRTEIVNPGASLREKIRVRRHRITVEQKIDYQNSAQPAPSSQWQKVCESWAEIRGNVVTIRFQPYLLPGMRVVIGSEIYEITAVIDRPGKTRLVELHISENRA